MGILRGIPLHALLTCSTDSLPILDVRLLRHQIDPGFIETMRSYLPLYCCAEE